MLTALTFALALAAPMPQTASAASIASNASAPPAAALSVDLDGDGTAESVTAVAHRRKVRVEIRSAAGKLVAAAEAPAPPGGGASVAFTAGSIGSAGSLLEVAAADGGQECRSVWRLHEGALRRIPLAPPGAPGRIEADCGPRDGWIYGWDQPSRDVPAEYRRERTRETPDGPHHVIESFRYSGFRLEIDPARSRAEIRGITIPSWFPARLYRKVALTALYARFDLASLKKSPRLRFRTDPAAGVFALTIDRSYGEWTLPVTEVKVGPGRDDLSIKLGFGEPSRTARMTIAGDGTVPGDVALAGFGEEVDGLYGPAMRIGNDQKRVYESAGDELAANGLVGIWTSPRGGPVSIVLASADPVLLGIGKDRFRVELEGAPDGVDALLVPREGANVVGIVLRGPDTLRRVAVQCDRGKEPATACHSTGSGELLHRVGARLNVR
jgi:hypothetical protein